VVRGLVMVVVERGSVVLLQEKVVGCSARCASSGRSSGYRRGLIALGFLVIEVVLHCAAWQKNNHWTSRNAERKSVELRQS